jgi:hypothetical protein
VVSFGLPILLYVFTFACNDVSGCPAPPLLSNWKKIDLQELKRDVGWPANGIWGLASWEVTGWTLAYYLFNAVLYRVLPAVEAEGVELSSGGRLKYRMNSKVARMRRTWEDKSRANTPSQASPLSSSHSSSASLAQSSRAPSSQSGPS